MGEGHRRGVFVSYARADGEEFARALAGRLEAEGLEVWMDRLDMQGGRDWWQQIVDAIDRAGFLVLVMTPGAVASEITAREWRYARERGVCVFPVQASQQLDFAGLPRWMAAKHVYLLGREWNTFLNYLTSPCQANRVPFMAPPLPEGYVHREAEVAAVRERLLVGDAAGSVAISTSLQGAGGYGKTTLAAAMCHDDDVQRAFDDGVLWVTLGRDPNVRNELDKLYRALTGQRSPAVDAEEAARDVADRLRNKRTLLVVDDVWQPDHLRWFTYGGEDCARIVTTRQFDVADKAGGVDGRVRVDEMDVAEAVAMVTAGLDVGPSQAVAVRRLVERLGEWPLLVKLARGVVGAQVRRGATIDRALEYVATALDRHGLTALDGTDADDRNAAASASVGVSVELLDDADAHRWADLAVFAEDTPIPLRTVGQLWELDGFETQRLAQRLDDLSLIELDLATDTMTVHDVLLAVAEVRVGDVDGLHRRLIDIWGDPGDLPDDDVYAWQWIGHHLDQVGRTGNDSLIWPR